MGLSRAVSEWKATLIALLVLTLTILLVDVFLLVFWGSQIRAGEPWIFGTNNKETLIGLLFSEGAVIFGFGALLASGVSELKIISPSHPGVSFILSRISSQREEHREKQISVGVFLMLVGGPLLAMSFIFALTEL